MAPSKAARSGQDDSKADAPILKEKNGGGTGTHASTKMRRVASSAGSNLREVTNASATSAIVAAAVAAAAAAAAAPVPDTTANTHETSTPGVSSLFLDFASLPLSLCSPLPYDAIADVCSQQLQWPAFERDVLHAYRRAYRLKTPTAFVSDHHEWAFTQPGSVGLYSPTIARRRDLRRQNKDQLTNVVRKHFNGLGVQENDVLVEFLHKVRSQGVTKSKPQRREYIPPALEQ